MNIKLQITFFLTLFFVLGGIFSLSAQDKIWTGAVDLSWHTPGNWNPSKVQIRHNNNNNSSSLFASDDLKILSARKLDILSNQLVMTGFSDVKFKFIRNDIHLY
jgi:hypothetical protein